MKLQYFVVLNMLFCCLFSYVKCDIQERKLSIKLNPDCEDQIGSQCEGITFVHVEASNEDSTIHYIWDFTGSPSVFLAKTDKNVTLGIDWNNFMLGKVNTVNFSSPPEFIFSAVIKRILLFDDGSDKANINDDSINEVTAINPHNFNWTRENVTQLDDQVEILMRSNVGKNGSFAIKVSCCSDIVILITC